jgi:hypothetical protein
VVTSKEPDVPAGMPTLPVILIGEPDPGVSVKLKLTE